MAGFLGIVLELPWPSWTAWGLEFGSPGARGASWGVLGVQRGKSGE